MLEYHLMVVIIYLGLDKAGNVPIHWACRGGHAEVVKLLLTQPVTLNVQVRLINQNKLGDTPLHMAAWGGHTECAELILGQPNVDLKLKNNDNQTAYELAKNDDVAALISNYSGNAASAGDMGDSDDDDD